MWVVIINMTKQNNNPRRTLWHSDVLNLSMKEVEDLLKLESAPNATYSNKTIVSLLINASASQASISHVSDLCMDAPCEGTIRYRLRNLELEQIQENFNEKLKIHADKTVPNNPHTYAIDFTNIPFYGKEKNKGDTIKTKPKQGTSRYYSYATIYLILNNKRYTLALKQVTKEDTLKDTVDFLINEITTKGFKIKGLYLDKEFFTVEMINYLQNRKIPFIIPCVKRGRSGGIRKLFEGNQSYSTNYTMRSKDNEAKFQVNVLVKYSKGKYKQKGRKYFAYAVYGMDLPIKKTFNEYRKRFGIESSYRLMNQARIHTSTKNPTLRLLYIGLSLLLINIWIYIQWKYLSIQRQGGRQPRKWTFPTMLRQLNRITEEKLGLGAKVII
jgi:putative transposase